MYKDLNCDSAYENLRLRTGNSVILSDRVNDKRKIEKFSNHILYTQRET